MNLHRVGRIAGVLVASQLRAGRSTSNPKSFLGRGYSILIYDALGFGLIFLLARAAAD